MAHTMKNPGLPFLQGRAPLSAMMLRCVKARDFSEPVLLVPWMSGGRGIIEARILIDGKEGFEEIQPAQKVTLLWNPCLSFGVDVYPLRAIPPNAIGVSVSASIDFLPRGDSPAAATANIFLKVYITTPIRDKKHFSNLNEKIEELKKYAKEKICSAVGMKVKKIETFRFEPSSPERLALDEESYQNMNFGFPINPKKSINESFLILPALPVKGYFIAVSNDGVSWKQLNYLHWLIGTSTFIYEDPFQYRIYLIAFLPKLPGDPCFADVVDNVPSGNFLNSNLQQLLKEAGVKFPP